MFRPLFLLLLALAAPSPAQEPKYTPEQITATVATMRMAETERAVLLARALAGEQAARFVVWAAWLRHRDLRAYGAR